MPAVRDAATDTRASVRQPPKTHHPVHARRHDVLGVVRHRGVPNLALVADQPADDVVGKWTLCSPETVRNFTAVGYLFAREIHQTRRVALVVVVSLRRNQGLLCATH